VVEVGGGLRWLAGQGAADLRSKSAQQMPKIKNIFYFGQGWANLVRTKADARNFKEISGQQGKSLRFALEICGFCKNIFLFEKKIFYFFHLREIWHFQPKFKGGPYISLQKYPPFYAIPGILVQPTGNFGPFPKILFLNFWLTFQGAFSLAHFPLAQPIFHLPHQGGPTKQNPKTPPINYQPGKPSQPTTNNHL
jgi:hypothetical protein